MTNKFKITQLSNSLLCSSYLLNIDGYNIMINCGTDHLLNPHYKIENIDINAILLTSSELSAIGNLPRVNKPDTLIYSTIPIKEIGELMLKEHCDILRSRNCTSYTEQEIESSFDKIITLKYSQRINLDNNIEVVGYNSGCSLGGTVWKITKNTEQILIGFNLNHRRENHLDGFDYEELKNINFTVLDSVYANKTHVLRKNRDKILVDIANKQVQNDKKCLIITKYSRIIEILSVLAGNPNVNFKENKIGVIGKNIKKFHETIKTHLEFTGEVIMEKFSKTKENPFLFSKMNFISEYKELKEDINILIIVENEILSDFALKIIYELSTENNNKIIFTESKYENLIELIESQAEIPIESENVKRIKLSLEQNKEYDNKHDFKEFDIQNKMFLNFIDNLKNEKLKINLPYFETIKIEKEAQELYKPEEESTVSIEMEEEITKFLPPYNEFTIQVNNFVFSEQKPKKKDEYGEFINITSEDINKENTEEKKEKNYIMKTIVKYSPETINLKNLEYYIIDFDGFSDIESIVTILENIKINRVIYTGENKEFLYFYHKYKKKYTKEIFCLDDTISFNFEQSTKDIEIKILPPTTPILKYNVAYVNGTITNNTLELKEKEGKCTLAKIKLHELKRTFIENNFDAEIEDNKIIVENQITLIKEHNILRIEGEMNDMYDVVKNIINKYLIYL
ncbi:Cleavage and polyadenylation specificity factor [Spraguea lophii 42_110]|uniref:Cleavage and polyadenylation specificity factor subunit 2 n=1 Tax=Spraguea lophii (strain 42_110) TaxID=1358809 RepID=S7W9F2_SPRLO|nr:Cleavage and polyadenylation specificity factor [Spraguea lophii 42_110]